MLRAEVSDVQRLRNKPTVEQMAELNRLGVCAAIEKGNLRKSHKAESAHIFLPAEYEQIEEADTLGMRYSTHRYVGRIARVGFQRWSMRIAESYWLRGIDNEEEKIGHNQDGYRTSYFFEWSKSGVMYANKHTRAQTKSTVEAVSSRVLAIGRGEPMHEAVSDVMVSEMIRKKGTVRPELLVAAKEFCTVSEADCELLIRDMHTYIEHIQA